MGTQCLFQSKPKSMLIRYIGELPHGTGAKDLILYTIAKIGVSGGTNYAIEYSGDAVRSLSMEGRMTICNMTIEAGARFGIIAPDETTFAWLKNKKFAPKGEAWDKAVATWRDLYSDEGATFDKVIEIDVSKLEPMVTYGTTPETAIGISDIVPDSEMLNYSGLKAGNPIAGTEIDYVFIGSCTNGRLADLREAAEILRGKKVVDGVQMIVVPGSGTVKSQAEAEGLDKVFLKAGAEWREPGCSLCLSMNGDFIEAGKRCISTSNRNFEGRQGPGSRTILASPATAAASAIKGVISDPRQLEVHHA
jgi:3-isopropylmalate/(R)-2-methylmalate dehydratase large subunit